MKRYLLLSVYLLSAGCVVQTDLEPVNGSRADGTVEMAFEYGVSDQPQINLTDAHQKAKDRCLAWGYKDAEPFGGQRNACEVPSGLICYKHLVTFRYQCVGDLK